MLQQVDLVTTKSCGRRSHKAATVKLTDNSLVVQRNGKERVLRLRDVVGCSQWKAQSPNDNGSYLSIISYPMIFDKQDADKRLHRSKQMHVLRLGEEEGYEGNYRDTERWMLEIRARIMNATAPHLYPQPPSYQRRLLALINPFSGPGKALQIFQKHVHPVLEEASIRCKVVITERANHAKEMVHRMDLSTFDGLIIVSGDGLCYEVLNGLMARDDRDKALECPLGILPGGSGNGLAAAVCYQSDEPYEGIQFARECAVMIARPDYLAMKLVHVETQTEHLAGFMGVNWGLISDIDIESEKFRKSLGHTRFAVFGVIRTCGLRTYRGRLSYLPCLDEDGLPNRTSDAATSTQNGNGPSPLFVRRRTTSRRMSADGTPEDFEEAEAYWRRIMGAAADNLGSGALELFAATLFYFLWTVLLFWHYGIVEPGYALLAALHLAKIPHERILPTAEDFSNNNYADKRAKKNQKMGEAWRRKYTSDDIPLLEDPVPDSWITLEDDFVNVNVAFLSHLASDALLVPQSEMDSDILHLNFITRKDATFPQVVRFLLGLENASHLDVPCLQMIPVRAVRLERISPGGNITIDGELIYTNVIQIVSTKYRATVMGKQTTRL